MKPDTLVDAALRDQERRIQEATPGDLRARGRSFPLIGPSFPRCGKCGGRLRDGNRTGYCQRTPECARLYVKTYNKARR